MLQSKTFPGQEQGEEIRIFLRRHWISFLPNALAFFVMLLLPFTAFLVIKVYKIDLGSFNQIVILGGSAEILIALSFFITAFVDYYLDISIVTNQRIIDIEQKGLFNRCISENNLLRIQDVKAGKKGMLQTFIDYGNVFIQTAGESPNFLFQNVPKPYEVAQKIMEIVHSQISNSQHTQSQEIKEIPQIDSAKDGL